MKRLRDSQNKILDKAVGLILPDGLTRDHEGPEVKVANLIMFRSADGLNWEAVKPADVPEWVKDPANVGQLVNGFSASRPSDPFEWRAERVQ